MSRNYKGNAPPWKSNVPKKRTADEQEDAWVAQEDRFVLRQAKKKAILRVRGGRAKPIDWLAVFLHAMQETDDFLEETEDGGVVDAVEPEGVLQGLGKDELEQLESDIDTYHSRELSRQNKDFWSVRLRGIC
jgi:hypothetical protein